MYLNLTSHFGPDFATDGLWPMQGKNTSLTMFSSKREDFPWLEWHLKKREQVIGVSITDRFYDIGDNLENIEIRAGSTSIDSTLMGRIAVNELCGILKAPGKNKRVHVIMCEKEITANYITVQRMEANSSLVISEIEIITKGKGRFYILLFRHQK